MGKVMRHTLGASLNIRHNFFFLMIRRPPRSTLFPYNDALPISPLDVPQVFIVSYGYELPFGAGKPWMNRSEEHTSELQSLRHIVCRLLLGKKTKMGKVMRHTLGASLNIRHNLSSSKGPKPLQLKLLTTYIPKTSAFTLAFSTSQRLRTTRASARTFFTFRHYITPSARNF